MNPLRAVLAIVLLASACAQSELGAEGQSAAIVDGAPTTGFDAVAAIAPRRVSCGEPTSLLCSGAVIAPDAVLSAAHCFDSRRPGLAYEAFVGDAIGSEAMAVPVSEVVPHPDFDSDSRENDVAIVWLAERVPNVVVDRLPEPDAAPPNVGEQLTIVGFGATEAGTAPDGVKRRGVVRVSEVAAGVLVSTPDPSVSCVGDSGGPLYDAQGRIIGVASAGDTGCRETSVYALVAPTVEGFIEPTLQMGPIDRPETLDACTEACELDQDCPVGWVCVPSLESLGLRCALPGRDVGTWSNACSNDADCTAGACAVDGLTDSCRCYEPCGDTPAPASSRGCTVRRRAGSPAFWLLTLAIWVWVRRR